MELGDCGFTRQRALIWNAIAGSAALPGAVLAYLALDGFDRAVPYVLALAAAGFLYAGLADLIPGLHRPGSHSSARPAKRLIHLWRSLGASDHTPVSPESGGG